MKNSRCVLRNLAVLAGMDCAATLGGKLFAALGVPETNIVMLYLFAVLLVARLTQGYQYGILASVTSLLTSAMTTKEKILTRQANERGEESRILYMLSSRLSDAADTEQVLGVALDSVSKLLQADAGCVYLGGQGQPIALQQVGGGRSFTAVWRTPGSCAPGLPTCAPSTWPGRRVFVFGLLYEGRSRSGR